MKKTAFLLLFICSILPIWSQTNIKFNGATFGNTLDTFISGFPHSSPFKSFSCRDIFNTDKYNGYKGYVRLNSKDWLCYILASRSSNKVFRTICNVYSADLEDDLMLLVKTLENKYGGHRQEKQEDLGIIVQHLGKIYKYKEMLALYYTIYNTNKKPIGEIRISCSPSDKQGKTGYIELCYTDFNTQNIANNECNSIMNNAL